jgi:hypothetical protein
MTLENMKQELLESYEQTGYDKKTALAIVEAMFGKLEQ